MYIKTTIGALAISATLSSISYANDPDPLEQQQPFADVRLKHGEPFLQARARLIKLGWKPASRDVNAGSREVEKRFAEHGFFELIQLDQD
jgi:hypothetical protein